MKHHNHLKFLRQTLQVAENSVKNGNHPFGALLIYQDRVIRKGENTVVTDSDVTAHAECNLIRKATRPFHQLPIGNPTMTLNSFFRLTPMNASPYCKNGRYLPGYYRR